MPAFSIAFSRNPFARYRSSSVSRTLKRPGEVGSGGQRESDTHALVSAFSASSSSFRPPVRFFRSAMPSKIERQTGSSSREYSVFAHAFAVPPCQATPFSICSMRSFSIGGPAFSMTSEGVESR